MSEKCYSTCYPEAASVQFCHDPGIVHSLCILLFYQSWEMGYLHFRDCLCFFLVNINFLFAIVLFSLSVLSRCYLCTGTNLSLRHELLLKEQYYNVTSKVTQFQSKKLFTSSAKSRSQGRISLSRGKVPQLCPVTYVWAQFKSAMRVGPQLSFVDRKTQVYLGEGETIVFLLRMAPKQTKSCIVIGCLYRRYFESKSRSIYSATSVDPSHRKQSSDQTFKLLAIIRD